MALIKTIEPLGPDHDRGAFSCGIHQIDAFFKECHPGQACPSHRTYVAVGENGEISGFYCLGPIVWEVKSKNATVVKSIEIEILMMGVQLEHQGKGIGGELVRHAFQSALKVVDAIGGIQRIWVGALNEKARQFYEGAGFTASGKPNRMYVTVDEIMDAQTDQ